MSSILNVHNRKSRNHPRTPTQKIANHLFATETMMKNRECRRVGGGGVKGKRGTGYTGQRGKEFLLNNNLCTSSTHNYYYH